MDAADPRWLQLILVAVLGLLAVTYLFNRQRSDYAKQVKQLQPKKVTELKTFTREEVAQHKSRDDVWIIVTDRRTQQHRVYDISAYVQRDEHPGGDAILNNAGGDSTEGFHGPQHPVTTFDLLEVYRIGQLAS